MLSVLSYEELFGAALLNRSLCIVDRTEKLKLKRKGTSLFFRTQSKGGLLEFVSRRYQGEEYITGFSDSKMAVIEQYLQQNEIRTC